MGDDVATVYTIAIVFFLLALAATILRFYARSIKKVGFSWDDYVIIPALVRRILYGALGRFVASSSAHC